MSNPTLPPKLNRLLDALSMLEDRNERIQTLIGISERFKQVPPSVASRPFPEDRKVPACESQAYVWANEQPDGSLKYWFAVENPQGISARSLAVILDETLSGADPFVVATVPGDIVYQIFGNELSMGKSMGLMGMVSMVQNEAKRCVQRRDGCDPSSPPPPAR